MSGRDLRFKDYPNLQRGYQYALDVVSKKQIACSYIIGACERFLNDLDRDAYIFDPKKAERFLKLAQRFKHVKGHWDNPYIKLEPWQCFVYGNIYGFINPRTGFRRFRIAYVEVARANSKSTLAAISGLYSLSLDNPNGNEISCFATKNQQARIVLDTARAMAKGNPSFLKATGTKVLAHAIHNYGTNSVMRAMSSEHGSLDGLNDALSIIDELHAVDQRLYDVIVSGLKKRRDSLLLLITTAGFNLEGVGYAQSNYAKRVALGEVNDDTLFSAVYTVDPGDDLFDENTWRKANPNYGVSVDPIAMETTAQKAAEIPSELANFKTKNLNIWTSEMSAFYDKRKWDLCADPEITEDMFRGQPCRMGVDLASRIDLTTYVKVFKRDDIYYVFDKSFVPEDTVKETSNTLYDDCIGKGYLIATKGNAIDQDLIRDAILEDAKKFKIIEAMFDVWNAASLMGQLKKERVECVEFRMTVGNFTEPMKTIDELIRKGRIRHNGSPLFAWNMANVVAKTDANGNVFPRKNSERLKIDLAVAFMMAMAGWIQDAKEQSVYEKRGIRII